MDIRDIYVSFASDRFKISDFPRNWELTVQLLQGTNAWYAHLFACVVQGIPLTEKFRKQHKVDSPHKQLTTWEQILFLHLQAWQEKGGSYSAFIHRQLRKHRNGLKHQLLTSELRTSRWRNLYGRLLVGEEKRFLQDIYLHREQARLSYQRELVEHKYDLAEPEASVAYAWSDARRVYVNRVEEELKQLQTDFLVRYARSPDAEWLVEVEISLLQRMLYGDTPVEGAHHVYGIWKLSGVNLSRLQQEFKMMMDGRTEELIGQKTKQGSSPNGLPVEAESLLEFTLWLRQRRYISRPGPPAKGIPRQLEWQGSVSQLETCFGYCLRHELFHPDISWDDFWDHFDSEYGTPMRWRHFNSLLVYWLDQLIEAGFFPAVYHKHFHVRLAEHFLNRYGAPLKPASLASTRSQSPNPRGHTIIDALIQLLGKPYE